MVYRRFAIDLILNPLVVLAADQQADVQVILSILKRRIHVETIRQGRLAESIKTTAKINCC